MITVGKIITITVPESPGISSEGGKDDMRSRTQKGILK
jgi:hypothetical protein